MQLAEDLWIVGSYYIDRSVHGELRVVGPHNHLHFGTVGFAAEDFEVERVEQVGGALKIEGKLQLRQPFIPDAAMGHIRRVRQYVEPDGRQGKASPTFAEVFKARPKALAPMAVTLASSWDDHVITYRRLYGNYWYGSALSIGGDIELRRNDKAGGFEIKNDHTGWIEYTLVADTNNRIKPELNAITKPLRVEDNYHQELVGRTSVEITHLINNNKTAGFGYGTVFPRDWMESADLGEHDLTPAARRYMYHKSLEHVAPGGEGWHEDVVGEYATNSQEELKAVASEIRELSTLNEQIGTFLKPHAQKLSERQVTRTMIDIEPRYILGLQRLRWNSLAPEDQDRLRLAATYVLDQAERRSLMTFKPLPMWERRYLGGEFGHAGNWRDSQLAFQKAGPVVAPYDVNVVLYPEALKIIKSYAPNLGVDKARAVELERKWRQTADWFKFTNPDGLGAFALALYGIREADGMVDFYQLRVNHLDEAYALFYGAPSEVALISFARRLMDRSYFYTDSGPILVGASERGYDTTQYHGKVTWTKQTAYVVGGLERQLARRDLGEATRSLLKEALVKTAAASLTAFQKLHGVPELHYDDKGTAKKYNEQDLAEGPSNAVQLWSAVGARRIIRAYNEAVKNGGTPRSRTSS